MRLTSVHAGDIVECDVKGRRFRADVQAVNGDGLQIRPLPSAVSYRHVTARQVIGHWRKAGRARTTKETEIHAA